MCSTPDISAGYLIVKTYDRMYNEYKLPDVFKETAPYSIPRPDRLLSTITKRYRGIFRDALEAWTEEGLRLGFPNIPTPTEHAACIEMAKLEAASKEQNDFIIDKLDARRVFDLIQQRDQWELIWARHADCEIQPPPDSTLLGYEPTWWTGNHFSAVMDTMCFPRWHGFGPTNDLLRSCFKTYFR